jgi:hypothetical protein
MDSKAELEYSRFLLDTINAAGHGLFELANYDPLIYPLQTWLHVPLLQGLPSTLCK